MLPVSLINRHAVLYPLSVAEVKLIANSNFVNAHTEASTTSTLKLRD